MNGEKTTARWPVWVALGLLALVTVVFVVEFVVSTEAEMAARAPQPLSPDSYLDEVTALLADADAQNGAALVERHLCAVCHREGADRIAPPFEGLAERAAERRPPLTAPAYLYEAIVFPAVYVVEGFGPSMPQHYHEVLTGQELGDIIAFLLSPDAH